MSVVLLTLGSEDSCGGGPRVPVLACADALRAGGAEVELVTATSDGEIDTVVKGLDAVPNPDDLARPGLDTRLVVAAATDGELRAVLRRLVRRYAPAPSRRPEDLAADRTMFDLPPIGVLPLDAGPDSRLDSRLDSPLGSSLALAGALDLPRTPAQVAAAVLGGRSRRLDLLRSDAGGGSVTAHGAMIGGADETDRAVPFSAVVHVDDAVLSTGDEPLLACAVTNASGYAALDGLPLTPAAVADDGVVDVAVAVPVYDRSWLGRRRFRIEVRRATGRAVAITPRGDVPYLDDGVTGTLARKRSWWIERAAWAVWVS